MSALINMHKLGVVHNDLAPRNFVVLDSRIRVIDFGEAEINHRCKGLGKCSELDEFQWTIDSA